MPSLQAVRRKIGSVRNTQKITKAMKMVAAAKLKRAQERSLAARPYAEKLAEVLRSLSGRVNREHYPLLCRRPAQRIELLVITADRGLCGAFNANVLRAAQEFIRTKRAEGLEISLSTVGRKARDFFRRRGIATRHTWVQLFDRLNFGHGAELGAAAVREYTAGEFDELYIVYNEFRSVMLQRVAIERLLPIEPGAAPVGGNYLYEPGEAPLLAALLPRYVEVQFYRGLLDSAAGELGARMTAMDSATRNAREMIAKLTLVYNKTRQAAITKELMDIVGGAEALKPR